ncbi:MAG TPA: multiheme c-type cytochrome [Sedimentisphaerales bacterium]|nr:multiheme c-type cytochrome [Sedimentisphaerales bacterium]
MKFYLPVFMLVAICIVGVGCEQVESVQKPQAGGKPAVKPTEETEEPLLLDDEPLLLLDDESQVEHSEWSEADNSRCFVCHVNYMQEDIAVIHSRADIGCAGCHGKSDEHIADESWASGGNGTAPEIMYPRPKINQFCMGCHPKDKIDTDQHKPLFANIEKMVCTDCHGDHRLAVRKCKWK